MRLQHRTETTSCFPLSAAAAWILSSLTVDWKRTHKICSRGRRRCHGAASLPSARHKFHLQKFYNTYSIKHNNKGIHLAYNAVRYVIIIIASNVVTGVHNWHTTQDVIHWLMFSSNSLLLIGNCSAIRSLHTQRNKRAQEYVYAVFTLGSRWWNDRRPRPQNSSDRFADSRPDDCIDLFIE